MYKYDFPIYLEHLWNNGHCPYQTLHVRYFCVYIRVDINGRGCNFKLAMVNMCFSYPSWINFIIFEVLPQTPCITCGNCRKVKITQKGTLTTFNGKLKDFKLHTAAKCAKRIIFFKGLFFKSGQVEPSLIIANVKFKTSPFIPALMYIHTSFWQTWRFIPNKNVILKWIDHSNPSYNTWIIIWIPSWKKCVYCKIYAFICNFSKVCISNVF